MKSKEPFILSIASDVVSDLRALHSRITDNEAIIEIHSADIAALSMMMQALAKRLSVIEARLGISGEDHVADVGDVVPGD